MWCDVVLKVVVLLVVAHFIKGMAVTADILHSERDMHLHLASGVHCSTMAPQARAKKENMIVISVGNISYRKSVVAATATA